MLSPAGRFVDTDDLALWQPSGMVLQSLLPEAESITGLRGWGDWKIAQGI